MTLVFLSAFGFQLSTDKGAANARVGFKSRKEKQVKKSNKWSVNNVITTVLMSLLLIVIQFVVNMVFMFNEFTSMVLSTGITMLLLAPIYFLMVQKVNKRGVSFAYYSLVGIVYLIMGNWYLLPYMMIVGLVLELILSKEGALNDGKKLSIAWVVASLLQNGVNILPIVLFWNTWENFARQSGMSDAYIKAYAHYFTDLKWLVFIVIFTTLCGVIGSLFAAKLFKKHFEKAGIL